MYNNSVPSYPPPGYHNTTTQYHNQQYSQEYSGTFGYQNYGGYPDQATVNQPVSGQEDFSTSNWTSYQPNQSDAVAQEMQQQKAQLIKQREDYVQKSAILRHELEQLQLQKQDLIGNGDSPNMDLSNILQHNAKLQDEIQGKMKAIHNVIEMLSGIIKDGKSITELEASVKHKQSHRSKSKSPSPKLTAESLNDKNSGNYCYVHYDTGLHWCRMCDVFPGTAKDLLLHLQEKKHKEIAKETDVDITPWHKLPQEVLMPSDENAPQKRIPIKGLQFFISAPSWYCKLCDVWIGDLHCASQHLKSQTHHQNYENFVTQNPHWEMEWIKDRENAMARVGVQDSSDSDDDDDRKKRRRKGKNSSNDNAGKEKKKKKRSKKKKRHSSDSSSSSSSSDSSSDDENDDKSKSIRVAMRNMQKVQSIMDEDLSAKWNVLEKLVEEHKKKEMKEKQEKRETNTSEDTLINQWMTVSQPPPKEKILLNSLKDRMRQKQEQERARVAELEKMRRERQREELEKIEKRKREERERAEQMERHRKQREQEELDRIRDKERSQVRFKTANNSLRRKKRSASRSDDEDNLDKFYKYERRNNEREPDREDPYKRSRSKSYEREERGHSERRHEESDHKKKPPGPPSYKKLPFIGRMPLFKNKSKSTQEEKEDNKEIKKQSYDPQRKTRFEPGNLPKAFIPKPDVVCFPKLSSIPPLTVPPPPPTVVERVHVPEAPQIRNLVKQKEILKAPPPPKFDKKETRDGNLSDDEVLYGSGGVNPSMMGQYYQEYTHNIYSYPVQEDDEPIPPPPPPHSHSMPLEPPPLPPDDDLALLGICADDMAAQSF